MMWTYALDVMPDHDCEVWIWSSGQAHASYCKFRIAQGRFYQDGEMVLGSTQFWMYAVPPALPTFHAQQPVSPHWGDFIYDALKR